MHKIKKTTLYEKGYKLDKYPILTHEELMVLFKQMKKGGEEGERARKNIIAHNIRLVIKIAISLSGIGIETNDLIQAGTLGLIRATDKFNLEKEILFSTYATWWIKNFCYIELNNNRRNIKIERKVNSAIRAVKKTIDSCPEKILTIAEISEKTGYDEKEVVKYLKYMTLNEISIYSTVTELEGIELIDVIANKKETGKVQQQLEEIDLHEKILDIINKVLREREKIVLMLYYGITKSGEFQEAIIHKQIGERLGVSREVSRTLLKRALEKIRRYDKNKGELSEFY